MAHGCWKAKAEKEAQQKEAKEKAEAARKERAAHVAIYGDDDPDGWDTFGGCDLFGKKG